MTSISNTNNSTDEQAIRDLVTNWLAASKADDLATLLTLMADDMIFMVPGAEPFGKEAFAAMKEGPNPVLTEATNEILEIKILGEWAWIRNKLSVTLSMPKGETMRLSGHTLTILRKNSDGGWVLYRDANLLTPES